MYKKVIIASMAIVLSIGAGMVRAQSVDSAWYGGIDLGRSRLGLGGGDFDNALANQGIGASSSNERSDTSLGFSVGYLFNRNFALEGAYTRLGEFNYSAAASHRPGGELGHRRGRRRQCVGFEERPADRRRGDVRLQPQRVRQGRLGSLRAARQRRHRQGPRRRVLDWSRLPVLRKEERGRSRGGERSRPFHFSPAGESIVGL